MLTILDGGILLILNKNREVAKMQNMDIQLDVM